MKSPTFETQEQMICGNFSHLSAFAGINQQSLPAIAGNNLFQEMQRKHLG